MRILLLAVFALVVLGACTNTRDGLVRDSERMGERFRAATDALTAP